MPARLGPETREAILQIKSAWASRPEYGTRITRFDISTAVLQGGVRTHEDFAAWVASRQHQPPETTPHVARRGGNWSGGWASGGGGAPDQSAHHDRGDGR
jgi:hypothetical protein